MEVHISTCEQHHWAVVCYIADDCPACVLQKERDRMESDAEYQESQVDEAQSEIGRLEDEIEGLQDEINDLKAAK